MIELCFEFIWTVYFTVCYHVTYAFQSESTVSSKEFLAIQATVECRFTLKHVRDNNNTHFTLYS